MDLTEDTVTEDSLHFGTTAHNAAGEPIYGKDATQAYVTFTDAETLENIQSGERLGVIFGKLRKWFSKLGSSFTLTNNLLANTPGVSALDAAVGPVIQGQIDELNNNLTSLNDNGQIENFHIGEDGKPYITYKVGADTVSKKLGDLPDQLSFTIKASTSPISSYAIYGVANVTIPTLGYKYMKRSDEPDKEVDISNNSTVSISQWSQYAGYETSVTITFYNR